jgi:hypothetical protein
MPAVNGAGPRKPNRGPAAAGPLSGEQTSPADGPRVSRDVRPGPVSGCPQTTVVLPPAAAIFSRAEAENAWALTCTGTDSSPEPSTLTG